MKKKSQKKLIKDFNITGFKTDVRALYTLNYNFIMSYIILKISLLLKIVTLKVTLKIISSNAF